MRLGRAGFSRSPYAVRWARHSAAGGALWLLAATVRSLSFAASMRKPPLVKPWLSAGDF